jgi:multimeric flavodoxin WrbA
VKVMILTCSPNREGLTAACGKAATEGIEAAGGDAVVVRLNDLNIGKCQACNNGWGTCLKEHRCQVEDDFQALHKTVGEVDGYVIVTPVYLWDMSESLKTFFDRLRRCEFTAAREGSSDFEAKPFVCVAAAGGTGNGTVNCLASMERVMVHMNHTRPEKFEYIGVTRRTRGYILEAIRAAGQNLVSEGSRPS